jgi:DNA (cytosine-5)-methyltransferase 1
MRAAGIEHLGIEIEPRIAQVARLNGFKTFIEDIRLVNYAELARQIGRLFWLHASLPCTRASLANSKGGEGLLDLQLAQAVLRAVRALKPSFVTLENVVQYRRFKSFLFIEKALKALGYNVKHWVFNMADYGVPQTRRRLFLIAHCDDGPVSSLFPTHSLGGDLFTSKWRGWYEAIEERGLIPTLESASFTDIQIHSFNKYNFDLLSESGFLADVRNTNRRGTVRKIKQPSFTIIATQYKAHSKGKLPDGRTFKMNRAAYAALQSMPIEYRFEGGSETTYQRIIGNGIPPLFSQKLGKHLISIKRDND